MLVALKLKSFTRCVVACLRFSSIGILVGGSMSRVKSWDIIIDRFRKRLSSWKVKLLSIGGRLTLTTSILGSLGIYFFLIFRLPASVCHFLEACRAWFFWGMKEDQRRIH